MSLDQAQVFHKAKQAVSDYEQLKGLYLALQAEHAAQTEALHVAHQTTEAARKTKDEMDRELHALYAQWDTDIKTQSAHFAALQQQMLPARELELVRARTTDELERIHRAQIDAIVKELDRYRELFAREHKDLELLRTTHDGAAAEHAQTVAVMTQAHALQTQHLQQRAQHLQALCSELETQHGDAMRKATRENHDLHMRAKVAADENAELRAAAERSVVERELAMSALTRERKELDAKVLLAERERIALNKKCDTLSDELETAQKQMHSAQSKALALEQRNAQLEESVANRDKEVRHSAEVAERRIVEFQKRMEEERQRQSDVIDKLQKELAVMALARDNALSSAASLEREHTVTLKVVREEELKKLIAVEKLKSSVESELQAERKARADLEAHATHQLTHLQQQIAGLSDAMAQTTRERDAAIERSNAGVSRITQLTELVNAKQNELNELNAEYGRLQTKHRALIDREHKNGVECERLRAEVESAHKELNALNGSIEHERKQHHEGLSARHNAWSQERTTLRAAYQRVESDAKAKETAYAAVIGSLKADKLKYKKMAQSLQIRVQNVTRDADALKRAHASELDAKRVQTDALTRQIHDLERSRDELRMRAGLTGWGPAPSASAALLMGTGSLAGAAGLGTGVGVGAGAGGATVLDDELSASAELAALQHRMRLQAVQSGSGSGGDTKAS